jgi:5-methylcytosine-specific restriction endonuclease McrA
MRVISQNGKQTKYNISVGELLSRDIIFPEYQRELLEEHSQQIVEFQKEHFKKHGSFIFLNCIQFCMFEGKWYCVDGQHRYDSFRELFLIQDWFVDIEITNCVNEEEVHEIFRIINLNKPLPDFFKKSKKEIDLVVEIKNYLQKYAKYFSKKEHPKTPNVHLDSFLDEVFKGRNWDTLNDFIEWFEIENNAHNEYLEKNIHHESIKIALDKIHAKSNDHFYLGCFWLKPLKNSLSQVVRRECWINYLRTIPENKGEILCYCCERQLIDAHNFEAGHIISFRNGGSNHANNLRPICGRCNKSMGTQNMDEFRERILLLLN